MTKPVILTGLRANNDLTLGNYFGGMLPIIDMATRRSEEFQVNMFIPDLHSFTTPIDHSKLFDQILHNARVFAAAGLPLDNPSIHLYRQSYVPAHSEMTWLLSCFTGIGEMQRMTQFKDKSSKLGSEQISAGLFTYPVLMAADILLYDAAYVPVGDDQTQHLEFTRDIAERMNSRFGNLFTVPEPVSKQHEFFGKDQGLRIMDLAHPDSKMSKSDDTGKGVIFLGDEPSAAAKKVMSATTDGKARVGYDKAEQPGVSNLLQILALLRGQPIDQVLAEVGGMERYGDFKAIVAREIETFLTDFQTKLAAVDDDAIIGKLEASEAAMSTQANAKLSKVQQALGLRPRSV
jgi:tryptophanyl-tRNA synthetase